jgi:hypothetical protein
MDGNISFGGTTQYMNINSHMRKDFVNFLSITRFCVVNALIIVHTSGSAAPTIFSLQGMGKGKFLTDEERDTIRSLAVNGVPLRTIAAAVKRSLGACQRVVSTPAENQRQKRQGSDRT